MAAETPPSRCAEGAFLFERAFFCEAYMLSKELIVSGTISYLFYCKIPFSFRVLPYI